MTDKDTKFYSSKQEKLVAKELGGYSIGGSGAMPGVPGDVKTEDWLVECKTHTQSDQNIFFDLNVWTKIKNEAMGMHKKPVLIVDDGSQTVEKTWCLCRANNLNLGSVISLDLPMAVRKNITCRHDKLEKALKDGTKRYIGAFYNGGVFEANWAGENVIITSLATFKELFNK